MRRTRQVLAGLYLGVGALGTLLIVASIVVELFLEHGERAPAPTPADLTETQRLLAGVRHVMSTSGPE